MQLPQEAIEEFKVIYEKEFHKSLSDEEASKLALGVYDFFKIVTKPVDKRAMRSFKIRKGGDKYDKR